MSQIIEKFLARETALGVTMKDMHPLVETYIQNLEKDDELAFHPTGDQYFLGKLDYKPTSIKERAFEDQSGRTSAARNSILDRLKQIYSVKYLPEGFEQMLVVGGQFGRNNYNLEYVRREFLGAVRCLVFDVMPKKGGSGTFKGRIWVEDQDYNVVRFKKFLEQYAPKNNQ